jgi:hypothetical protein
MIESLIESNPKFAHQSSKTLLNQFLICFNSKLFEKLIDFEITF